jgi:hypothetical protein
MIIDEAIKEMEAGLADRWCPWGEKMKASIRLGIEALKWYKRWRSVRHAAADYLLPGETAEIQKAHGLPLGGITIKLSGETEE